MQTIEKCVRILLLTCLLVLGLAAMGRSQEATKPDEAGVSGHSGLPAPSRYVAKATYPPAPEANACSAPQPKRLTIPPKLFERAKLKARLADLLRESLYDDANQMVDVAREREIRELMKKLSKGGALGNP